jgi:arsenite methyltransferase
MPQDLMFQNEIRQVVAAAYSEIPAGGGEALARRLYSQDELDQVPPDAVTWALGVGNPIRHAELQPGEVALDVGSGGGIDSIMAAKRVGPHGRIVGLDMLDAMVDRAGANSRAAGVAEWTQFVRGEMEDIPLPDQSVDVVFSNGVINLSARKSRALGEIFRVLRPGGRLCVADLVVEDDLPPEIMTSDSAWAG